MHFNLPSILRLVSIAVPTRELYFWSALPFILMLCAIAGLPLVLPKWWKEYFNKGIIVLLLGLPVIFFMLAINAHVLLMTAMDYLSFIILLGALYVIGGGIYIRGSFAGTPIGNTIFLGIGALLASFIGTTGASMVLIKPILRSNKRRIHQAHIIIFFIFIVSNIGGCLTPLGDPPLFLGFLKGVPFFWTMNLLTPWLLTTGLLLIIFNLYDQWMFNKEDMATRSSLVEQVEPKQHLKIDGEINILFLVMLLASNFLSGYFKWSYGVKELIMVAITVLSLVTTAHQVRHENAFTYNPIIEVALVFAGIFATMVPVLLLLNTHGHSLGLTQPWHFFWATGVLSSFLDNAPTYLALTSTASGLLGIPLDGSYLSSLLSQGARGVGLLKAISLGAVFMGANTYIGNGPNFMVRAIAEEAGIKMPSFLGYMKYALLILIPLFIVVTVIFFI